MIVQADHNKLKAAINFFFISSKSFKAKEKKKT